MSRARHRKLFWWCPTLLLWSDKIFWLQKCTNRYRMSIGFQPVGSVLRYIAMEDETVLFKTSEKLLVDAIFCYFWNIAYHRDDSLLLDFFYIRALGVYWITLQRSGNILDRYDTIKRCQSGPLTFMMSRSHCVRQIFF